MNEKKDRNHIRFELLPPSALQKAVKDPGLVFLPVGSMEWHGPHMAMGMDTCNAYESALRTAEIVGGVVFPPLYIGTETPRSPETLKKLGFSGEENIVGMDFPANSFKSMYWPPALFEQVLRCQLGMLCRMGFGKIVVMNGHGADEQLRILHALATELEQEYQVKILVIMALFEECGYGIGHAGLVETAIMTALYPDAVDLAALPERSIKLRTAEYGIADSETFEKGPNEDFTVRYDPRDATPRIGESILNTTVEQSVRMIREYFSV